jgi:EAL domain-containing protein (putative c-di-GMP-specific phosphodiesterase class I)
MSAETFMLSTVVPAPGADSVDKILQAVREHLRMDVAFASRICAGQVTLRNVATNGNLIAAGDVFDAEDGYCQRIIDGRLPYVMPDTAAYPEATKLACTRDIPVGSHLSVPLRLSDGSVYGTFCCFSHVSEPNLNERDLQTLKAFAQLAAGQIEAELRRDHQNLETELRVREVVERDDLTVLLQPIYAVESMTPVGVEALARFGDHEHRPPNEWFAAAQSVGLGCELELCAVRAALRTLRHIPEHLYLAINVSPETAAHPGLVLELAAVPPGRVVLEITEHAIVRDYIGLGRALEALRPGVRIAVDDAGAGYSGLRHILDIQPDIIKLDLTLTRGIDRDLARAALATALIAFANQIGSKIVAEGVETAEELARLLELGVEGAQGYFLGRPVPSSKLAAVIGRLSNG